MALIKWCAYYGDVSAIRFLVGKGESLESLGENLGLNEAVFHGHWQLCQFLIEHGANVNYLTGRYRGDASARGPLQGQPPCV